MNDGTLLLCVPYDSHVPLLRPLALLYERRSTTQYRYNLSDLQQATKEQKEEEKAEKKKHTACRVLHTPTAAAEACSLYCTLLAVRRTYRVLLPVLFRRARDRFRRFIAEKSCTEQSTKKWWWWAAAISTKPETSFLFLDLTTYFFLLSFLLFLCWSYVLLLYRPPAGPPFLQLINKARHDRLVTSSCFPPAASFFLLFCVQHF